MRRPVAAPIAAGMKKILKLLHSENFQPKGVAVFYDLGSS